MIAFSRLSTGPNFLPGRIRIAAVAQTASGSHTAPIATWCRAPMHKVPQERKPVGLTWQSRPPSPNHVRRAGRAVAIRACFLGASFVLAAARLLLRMGLLRSGDAATALRWSSRLTATGMQLWRQRRLRERR